MRTKAMLFALSTCAVFGQDAARVFQFHHIETAQDLNEFATMVRTISDIPQLTVDAAQRSISVQGTASQIAIAEFLFTDLDRQTVPDTAVQELRVSNNTDDVVHVFFAPNASTVQEFQEIATVVRTIAEIRRVFTYATPRALAVRGTSDQIAATAFLVHELDQPAAAKRTDSRQYQMIDTANHGETEVRVFYVPYTATVQQFQEVATVVRNLGEVRRIFTYNTPRALIARGTADQVAFAGWMVRELGKPLTPGTGSETYSYAVPDRDGENFVRVFYVKEVPTPAALLQLATQIRTTTKMRRVFAYSESKALALRGTEAQLATAAQMLQDRAQVASK
jgi:hypothetical protein